LIGKIGELSSSIFSLIKQKIKGARLEGDSLFKTPEVDQRAMKVSLTRSQIKTKQSILPSLKKEQSRLYGA